MHEHNNLQYKLKPTFSPRDVNIIISSSVTYL